MDMPTVNAYVPFGPADRISEAPNDDELPAANPGKRF
jgi:hypothetical protein